MADVRDFNLLGKENFSEAEAAHYACVSPSQFRAKAAEYGILPVRGWMGRTIYRKKDIDRAIEDLWQRSNNAASRGCFPGSRTAGNNVARLGR